MNKIEAAYITHKDAAAVAFNAFRALCGQSIPRVPGMDTVIRLAWRIECGKSIEEAAAAEYLYRWNLAVKAFDQCGSSAVSIFGAPHLLGM